MQIKRIIFISVSLSGIIFGMDRMDVAENCRQRSLLGQFVADKGCNHIMPLLPNDIMREIATHVMGEKEWWYLDKVFVHDDYVRSICYHPSGMQLATGSDDKKARIFDIATKKEIALFVHGGWVNSICYHPSGKQLATAADDTKARIFDVATQKEIASFVHDDCVRSVCYHPSGKQLATGSADQKARIFTRYTEYTLDQLLLKKMLLMWLLIEKPDKKINSPELLLVDVAVKCGVGQEELVTTWQSLPETLRSALWRTMWYKIEQYGKNVN